MICARLYHDQREFTGSSFDIPFVLRQTSYVLHSIVGNTAFVGKGNECADGFTQRTRLLHNINAPSCEVLTRQVRSTPPKNPDWYRWRAGVVAPRPLACSVPSNGFFLKLFLRVRAKLCNESASLLSRSAVASLLRVLRGVQSAANR